MAKELFFCWWQSSSYILETRWYSGSFPPSSVLYISMGEMNYWINHVDVPCDVCFNDCLFQFWHCEKWHFCLFLLCLLILRFVNTWVSVCLFVPNTFLLYCPYLRTMLAECLSITDNLISWEKFKWYLICQVLFIVNPMEILQSWTKRSICVHLQ